MNDKLLLKYQKNEITEHMVYKNLARMEKSTNSKILFSISEDELKHYTAFKKITKRDIKPDILKVAFYTFMGIIFGITFAAKFMEKGEESAGINYGALKNEMKSIKSVIKDEAKHEDALIKMINEEKLGYISSMVLGLNDAIVELTGALAGFTFALQNTRVIGTAGVITGIAAAFSMAAAEYLSQKSEKSGRNPLKAALYTGLVYIAVVFLLILPYFLASNCYLALCFTIIVVMIVIAFFSFFVSVVQEKTFGHTFIEMTVICLGVSFIAFLIGLASRSLFNIQI